MRIILLTLLVSILNLFSVVAQEGFPINGVKDKRPGIYAFTNATIFTDFQSKIENATLLIENGEIKAVGTSINIPKGAIITDLKGKTVYPAWIEPYGNYGLPKVPANQRSFNSTPQFDSKRTGPYGWNENILSDYRASENITVKAKDAGSLKKLGFGAVNTVMENGLIRGTSALLSLAELSEQQVILKTNAAANFSFQNASSSQVYPNSVMGRVALIRQTYIDAEWYGKTGSKEQTNLSLEAFNEIKNLPSIFEVSDKHRALLADKIGDEAGVQYIIKGTGDEYQWIDAMKKTNASFILSLNFPKAYDVEDPYAAMNVSYDQMKHWEMAPANAKMFAEKGISFAFTADGLKKKSDYLKNIRNAIRYGLSESDALKAMTYTPANMLGAGSKIGSLKKGMLANFVVTSGNIFEEKTVIHETWVHGIKTMVADMNAPDYAGNYQLNIDGKSLLMEITGTAGKQSIKVKLNDSTAWKGKSKIDGSNVTISYKDPDADGSMRMSGWRSGNGFKGKAQKTDGSWVSWTAIFSSAIDGKEKSGDQSKDEKPTLGKMLYPFMAFGNENRPIQEKILFKNATVWTNESEGIIENTDVLVENGKIRQVGKNLSSKGAKVIDAAGKHLTSGIIDEHSHAALSSVNEGSHAVTAEVRMYDAVDAEDIDIYRQLAGGVTAAQLLHGSANPVGGQSALVKFRWGVTPDEMKIKGADGFIKFALGENVKQSNWGDNNTIRFPQTRMGVEQVYVNAFTKAQEYDAEWKKYNKLSAKAKLSATKPRRDLQMETLAEILNSERFISCHSYVQSEINMLMKVAESFNFRINTFTHILEGYKVADKMAEHGAGGSTFADWWAYKYEVREAIPYNANLMQQAGVTVAINSDDGEMARRLNQEAAKSVKYGGMSEEDAWKLVTLNPAKLLHLDDRMGSVKAGKDADLVLWNTNPLSIYAKAEKTLIDGIVYFDVEKDKQLRADMAAEKVRLINKMRGEKKAGKPTQKPSPRYKHNFHCEDLLMFSTESTEK